jgi:hypothetical protein
MTSHFLYVAATIARKNQLKAAKISRKHPKSAEISQNQLITLSCCHDNITLP